MAVAVKESNSTNTSKASLEPDVEKTVDDDQIVE
jgi:hypothetical protein